MFETTNYIDTNIADILYVTGFVGNKISAGNNLKPDFPSLAPPRNVVLRAWIVKRFLSFQEIQEEWLDFSWDLQKQAEISQKSKF